MQPTPQELKRGRMTPSTHGSYRGYPHLDTHEPLKRAMEHYGPDRCVRSSNFSNALWSKGISYTQTLTLFTKDCAFLRWLGNQLSENSPQRQCRNYFRCQLVRRVG